jgi:3-oxoacyl-[acyl-carrier protein] reductase
VTGGARGIGKAIAARLLKDSFQVVLADVDAAAGAAAVRELSSTGNISAAPVDLVNAEAVQAFARSVAATHGTIDVLINNAGIAGMAAPVVEYPELEWHRIIDINLNAVFYCVKAVLPFMIRQQSGRIINIASIAGKEGNPNMTAYSASKAGVIGFTKALAKEVATQGIYVNCITPAVIATEILSQLTDEAVKYMVTKIPMGRVGQPEEVAALVSWLASPECSFSTGAVFDISGGRATY